MQSRFFSIIFPSCRLNFFLIAEKLSQFGQEYRLMNGVMARFNTTMVKMTKLSQQKK